MFAVFGLNPECIFPSGADVPPNIPNEHYNPTLKFKATKLTDDLEHRDNAVIAKAGMRIEPGLYVGIAVLAKEAVVDGYTMCPAADVMPLKPVA